MLCDSALLKIMVTENKISMNWLDKITTNLHKSAQTTYLAAIHVYETFRHPPLA